MPKGGIICVNMDVALVDPEDWERLHRHTWYSASIGVSRKDKGGKTVYLHREVMGEPVGLYVGFRDENKLNCRKKNLFLFEPGKRREALTRLTDNERTHSNEPA